MTVLGRIALGGCLLMMAAGGCGSGGGDGDKTATVRAANPHGMIHAGSGDTVVLSFASQPGVGYGWTLASNTPTGVLLKRDERFVPRHSNLVGGPGQEQFTFRAARAGQATLRFRHDYRGRTRGVRRVAVTVVARGG